MSILTVTILAGPGVWQ